MVETSYKIEEKPEPKPKKRMKALLFVLALVIIGFGVSSVYLIDVSLQVFDEEVVEEFISETSVEEGTEETVEVEDIRFLVDVQGTDFPEEAYVLYVEGAQAVCQPEEFNLDENLYYVPGGEKSQFTTEEEEKAQISVDDPSLSYLPLKDPYKVVPTTFSCEKGESYILDVRKAQADGVNVLLPGNRQVAFAHVTGWAISDFNQIFVSYSEKNAVEDWELSNRIYSPATGTFIDLPAIDCVSDNGFWDKDKLITYAQTDSQDTTDFCVWSDSGDLISRFNFHTEWNEGLSKDKFGYVSHTDNIFYVLSKRAVENCKAYVFKLNDPETFRIFNIRHDEETLCRDVEVNLDVLSLLE